MHHLGHRILHQDHRGLVGLEVDYHHIGVTGYQCQGDGLGVGGGGNPSGLFDQLDLTIKPVFGQGDGEHRFPLGVAQVPPGDIHFFFDEGYVFQNLGFDYRVQVLLAHLG